MRNCSLPVQYLLRRNIGMIVHIGKIRRSIYKIEERKEYKKYWIQHIPQIIRNMQQVRNDAKKERIKIRKIKEGTVVQIL